MLASVELNATLCGYGVDLLVPNQIQNLVERLDLCKKKNPGLLPMVVDL